MVEENTEWLDGMIHEAIKEDGNLQNKCFDIAKGGYNSAFFCSICFVFGGNLVNSVVT
jgi:hypothetical protein